MSCQGAGTGESARPGGVSAARFGEEVAFEPPPGNCHPTQVSGTPHSKDAASGDAARRKQEPDDRLPTSREEPMVAHVDVDIAGVWRDYKESPSIEQRNQLVEHYLPLVKYNAERIWARLPDGVDLDDLISAGIFGL